MKTKFEVLMFGEEYIDANALTKGIYATDVPFVYPEGTTISMIEERGRDVIKQTGAQFVTEEYFVNLKKCKLITFVIKKHINLEI